LPSGGNSSNFLPAGYRAKELVSLASYFSSVGFADERMYIFLALGLEKAKLKQEADERITEVLMPIEVIQEKLAAQEFEDAKTILGLREYLAYLERKPVK
jgi:ADP-ribose pyrophosphatase